MNAPSLFFALLLAHGVSAQQPATVQQPTKPVEPCQLLVPTSIALNSDAVPPLQCDCRITAFKGTIYSRWGAQLFATEDPARFPGDLLDVKDLQPGTYMWVAEYTAILGTEPLVRKATGYVNVL